MESIENTNKYNHYVSAITPRRGITLNDEKNNFSLLGDLEDIANKQ